MSEFQEVSICDVSKYQLTFRVQYTSSPHLGSCGSLRRSQTALASRDHRASVFPERVVRAPWINS